MGSLENKYMEAQQLFDPTNSDISDSALVGCQAEFLAKNVPFYSQHYSSTNRSAVSCRSDYPNISTSLVRTRSSLDFLCPKEAMGEDYYIIERATGGTTGASMSVFYTQSDWHVLVDFQSFLKNLAQRPVGYNCYNQGHVSGPIFSEGLAKAGTLVINRPLGIGIEDVLSSIKSNNVRIIVAPSLSTRKGISLENLLELDSLQRTPYINGRNIDAVIVSSTCLDDSLFQELTELGVTTIINLYGSTEIFPLAVGCPLQPQLLHTITTVNRVDVVTPDGTPVEHGGEGFIRASRVGRIANGFYVPSRSTGLVNYVNGDVATVVRGSCPCGFSGLSLLRITRHEFVQEKLQNGCQEW
jgi:phenylacetate-coenzyme A ligase PaaK-like adenylate-forming protein